MRVKIKICGLTNLADARWAVDCGADYLGFVMVPQSPRFIDPAQVAEICRQLPAAVQKVGVFMNRPATEVMDILAQCGLDIAQLHGDETDDTAVEIGVQRVWKAVSLTNAADISRTADFPAAALLVDTAVHGRRGGTGRVGDWALAAALAGKRRIILAGGLNPENVGRAVAAVHPFGVDVSSGVEAKPGRKEPDAVRRFIENASAEI
jgi:phosphoribosylanthranilate isomerase